MDSKLKQNTPISIILWLIWAGLTSSVFMYFVVLQISGTDADTVVPPKDSLVKILTGVAILSFTASFVIRKKVTLPLSKKLEPENYQQLMPSCIISWALAESIAIYGLVLGFTGAPMSTCGLFFVAGFGAMIFLSPNFAPLKGFLKALPEK